MTIPIKHVFDRGVERLWTLAGMVVAASVMAIGFVMGRSTVSGDYNRLRLDVDESLEKASHLFDRARKRMPKVAVEETTSTVPPQTPEGRKAALRRRAFERGLMPVGLHLATTGRRAPTPDSDGA